MTEEQYCNISDLQILRMVENALNRIYCFNSPNKERRLLVEENVSLMVRHLVRETQGYVEEWYS